MAEHFRDASALILEKVIRFKAFHFRITISALNVWALTNCNHYYIDEHVDSDFKDDDGDSINDDVRVALESLVHSRHPRPL